MPGLFNRIGLLAVIALIGAMLVFHTHRSHERLVGELLDSSRSVVDRALLLEQALQRAGSTSEPELIAALSDASFRVTMNGSKPSLPREAWRHAEEVEALLLPWLNQHAPNRAELLFRMRRADDAPGPPQPWLGVLLQQPDGRWLLVESRLRLLRGPTFVRLSWTILTVVLLVLAILWFSRRLQRPLNRLAAAADRLGEQLDTDPMPERGSREVRRATRAFNNMQARLQSQMRERTTMAAALSHDLRTLLTRLRLNVELADSEERRRALGRDIEAMTAILDTSLAWARADHQDEPPQELDLGVLCHTLIDEQQDRGVDARYTGPDHHVVRTRVVSLQRVLVNLIDNAVRHGGSVDLTLLPGATDVVIEVSDRGPGIPADLREQAFEPFARLDVARNQSTEGSGLGLAIVRSVVEASGGSIELTDRDGGGLIARLSLPL